MGLFSKLFGNYSEKELKKINEMNGGSDYTRINVIVVVIGKAYGKRSHVIVLRQFRTVKSLIVRISNVNTAADTAVNGMLHIV